ncbi:hypothetical protein [Alkalicoccus daliensis]|uniref:EcsC protein family protein n=1 Tax=Alkalicoccus daliensis TaxID=745820 RepID=A0A1H0EV17_9BACI|nr:hypothetical protein [Alkalicoccus daliensis]SDN86218.1 EcsC protein family protein [Alkalicoccus daliensis]
MDKLTTTLSNIILKAGQMPGYKVRPMETYKNLKLQKNNVPLSHPKQVYTLEMEELDKAADEVIKKHNYRFAATGAAVGAPGGPVAMFGGAVIDIEEYIRRMFLLTQELGHIYGVLPNPFSYNQHADNEEYFSSIQLELMKAMVLGLGGKGVTIGTLQTQEEKGEDNIDPQTMYQLAMKIADLVGKQKLKKHLAKVMGRSVPLLGGGINGTLNYYFIKQLGRNLKDEIRQEHVYVREYLNR